jgi:lysozyme
MIETLEQRLLRHEGIRLRAYKDSIGKLTIGVGRCLETKGISEDEAMYMLKNDIDPVKEGVAQAFPWILGLDDARKDVLYEMAFQLGVNGLSGFKAMLVAVRDKDWPSASKSMLQSAWHTQTPNRCEELAEIMLTGEL